eukprot:543911-Rhodomonas_salina.1
MIGSLVLIPWHRAGYPGYPVPQVPGRGTPGILPRLYPGTHTKYPGTSAHAGTRNVRCLVVVNIATGYNRSGKMAVSLRGAGNNSQRADAKAAATMSRRGEQVQGARGMHAV